MRFLMGRKIRGFLALVIVICLSVVSTGNLVFAQSVSSSKNILCQSDLLAITSYFVHSQMASNENCKWTTSIRACSEVVTNKDGDTKLFNISLKDENGSPSGFIVINANVENPCILEFSFSGSVESAQLQKDYFLNNEDSSEDRSMNRDSNSANIAHKIDKQLSSKNDMSMNFMEGCRRYAEISTNQRAFNDDLEFWGIFSEPPSGGYAPTDQGTLNNKNNFTVFKTNHFTGSNHCGATACMNIASYFQSVLGYNALKPDPTSTETQNLFSFFYKNTGNGSPTLSIIEALNKFTNERLKAPYAISTYHVVGGVPRENLKDLSSKIKNQYMPCMVIWNNTAAHWINILGFWSYDYHGYVTTFVQVLSGWDTSPDHYYAFIMGNEMNPKIGGTPSYIKISKN